MSISTATLSVMKQQKDTLLRNLPKAWAYFRAGASQPLPLTEAIRTIRAERVSICVEIERCAVKGMVPEGLIDKLCENYVDELAEWNRQLGELESDFESHMRRLEGLFPEPPAPEPKPRQPRHTGRIGDMLARPKSETRH